MTTQTEPDTPLPDSRSRVLHALPLVAWVVAIGALLLLTPVRVPDAGQEAPGPASASTLVALGGLSVLAGILLGRRNRPLALALVCWPFAAVLLIGTFVWGWGFGLLTLAVQGARESWRRAAPPAVLLMVLVLWFCASGVPAMLPVGLVDSGAASGDEVLLAIVLYTLPIAAALAGARAIGAARDARRATARAEQEAHLARVDGAVTAERARLARDLHDVVAHHISLIAVRAEAAPYLHPDLDDRAREVLAGVAADARQALDELRQVLTVLRRSQDAERAPQPGAADILTLVETARAAGQQIDATAPSGAIEVPAATGYVLYRVAQEALTNARRHAPGSPVRLDLVGGADGWGLRVQNPVADGGTGTLVPGRGIAGMQERVATLGGTLDVTGAAQEVVVHALLPRAAAPDPASEPAAQVPA